MVNDIDIFALLRSKIATAISIVRQGKNIKVIYYKINCHFLPGLLRARNSAFKHL